MINLNKSEHKSEKISLKEVIVVEGKDDIAAVKKAVDAEIIATHGWGFPTGVMERILFASKRCGIIVLTDPDFAGEKIRSRISEAIPEAKHAFLPREEAIKDDDIGVENASPMAIVQALSHVRESVSREIDEFTYSDIAKNALTGMSFSKRLRNELGKKLGIGYGNSKQFLSRLNKYGVTREEFESALDEILKEEK